jgi:hypothetical protein
MARYVALPRPVPGGRDVHKPWAGCTWLISGTPHALSKSQPVSYCAPLVCDTATRVAASRTTSLPVLLYSMSVCTQQSHGAKCKCRIPTLHSAHGSWACSLGPRKAIEAAFTSPPNPKYFLLNTSHQIFRRMHGALNVCKKDN